MNNRQLHSESFVPNLEFGKTIGNEEEVVHLLRDFFRHEMPDPWPAPPEPVAEQRPASVLRWAQRSRRYLALAAAVGLFIGSYWALSYFFPDAPATTKLQGPGMARDLDPVPLQPGFDDLPPAIGDP